MPNLPPNSAHTVISSNCTMNLTCGSCGAKATLVVDGTKDLTNLIQSYHWGFSPSLQLGVSSKVICPICVANGVKL